MLETIKQFYKLFSYGHQVSDPAFWKKGQAIVQPVVAALIMLVVAIAKGMGYDLPVSDELAVSIAGTIFFIVNSILTVITSKHIGVQPRAIREAQPSVSNPEQSGTEEPASVQSGSEAPVGRDGANQSIDEDVRARALEWARQHSAPFSATNNLTNDA
jgi:hypothetical protein